MCRFSTFCLTIGLISISSNAINFSCRFNHYEWRSIRGIACHNENVNVDGPATITSINNKKVEEISDQIDKSTVKHLSISKPSNGRTVVIVKVKFLPKGFANYFPDLEGIDIAQCQLTSLKQEDLKPFTHLKELSLIGNNLETLDSGLFAFNPELWFIQLRNNKLKIIGADIFSQLTKLSKVLLVGNDCVDKNAESAGGIEGLVEVVRANCSITSAIDLWIARVTDLEAKLVKEQEDHSKTRVRLQALENDCNK